MHAEAIPGIGACYRRNALRRFVAQHAEGFAHRVLVVLGQMAGVGSRIREHLVLLVECLRDRQGGACGEAEARVRLALKGGEVEQEWRGLGGWSGLFGHAALPALAGRDDRLGLRPVPEALGSFLGIVLVLLESRVEPAARVLSSRNAEVCPYFEVGPRHETLDPLLALDHDRQGGGLHAAHGGQVEAAVLGIERGHRTRAIDADQPVGFGAAARGIGQRHQLLAVAQALECLPDRLGRHRLQPKALDRLPRARVLRDQAKDEFALASGIAGIDDAIDVLALDQSRQQLEPLFVACDRVQVEVRRDDGQVRERPFAALDLHAFGRLDLDQMPDRGGHHVTLAFEIVLHAWQSTERAGDVGGDGGFLGDDQ